MAAAGDRVIGRLPAGSVCPGAGVARAGRVGCARRLPYRQAGAQIASWTAQVVRRGRPYSVRR